MPRAGMFLPFRQSWVAAYASMVRFTSVFALLAKAWRPWFGNANASLLPFISLKGLKIFAQGIALGFEIQAFSALKGRDGSQPCCYALSGLE